MGTIKWNPITTKISENPNIIVGSPGKGTGIHCYSESELKELLKENKQNKGGK